MKDYLKDMVIYFLNKFQIEGEIFKIIHCNNAGENEDLGNSCTKYFVVINLEVASPETLPKQIWCNSYFQLSTMVFAQ